MGVGEWRNFDFQQNMSFKNTMVKDHINKKILVTDKDALLDAGKGCGTLAEFGVKYDKVPLLEGGVPDLETIAKKAANAKVCHVQRSRGYSSRAAFDLETIGKVVQAAKSANPVSNEKDSYHSPSIISGR